MSIRTRPATKEYRDNYPFPERSPGTPKPWNWCPHCEKLVDADDVSDGSEVRCLGCLRVFTCVSFTDGTWRLDEPCPPKVAGDDAWWERAKMWEDVARQWQAASGRIAAKITGEPVLLATVEHVEELVDGLLKRVEGAERTAQGLDHINEELGDGCRCADLAAHPVAYLAIQEMRAQRAQAESHAARIDYCEKRLHAEQAHVAHLEHRIAVVIATSEQARDKTSKQDGVAASYEKCAGCEKSKRFIGNLEARIGLGIKADCAECQDLEGDSTRKPIRTDAEKAARAKAETECCLWGVNDPEELHLEDPDETIAEYIESIPEEDLPETITLHGYKRMAVTFPGGEKAWVERTIDEVVERLEEGYGDPGVPLGERFALTDEMRAAGQTFLRAILASYTPWACEEAYTEEVNVREWLRLRCRKGEP